MGTQRTREQEHERKIRLGFSEQELAAIKERAAELRKEGRKGAKQADAERDVVDKIAGMPEPDRHLAARIHSIVTTQAPQLQPRLWYSQPAWAHDGKVVCFFRSGNDDKERYSTFGFSADANLDEPTGFWPTSFALTEMTPEAEEAITQLVRKATA